MSQWGVVDFVSRVAERVTTGRGGVEVPFAEPVRLGEEERAFAYLRAGMPFVEPSPEFVAQLYHQLMTAPEVRPVVELDAATVSDHRIVYGVAAIGSLASAAVVAAFLLRTRSAHRAA